MERRKRSWLTRRDKVELFEQIRRELEFGVGTIAGVSRKLGVHRRMVREALHSAEPVASKPSAGGFLTGSRKGRNSSSSSTT